MRRLGCLIVVTDIVFFVLVVALVWSLIAASRGGPESGAPPALPEASRPAATVIPTASARASGTEGTRASGNLARPTPTPHPLDDITRSGIGSHMGSTQGPGYLALPIGRGWIVELCGPADCVTRTSTDAGPDLAMQRAGRVADLYVGDFERICGVPRSMGLCPVSWTVIGRSGS